MFKKLRIAFLLVLLLFVAGNAWLNKVRTTTWDRPLWVVVYPINGDASAASSRYIGRLRQDTFQSIEEFMGREASRHSLKLGNPVTIKLAPEVAALPPRPPRDGNMLGIMWWSLKMRYWAFRADSYDGPAPDIRMFVVYYDPATHDVLNHSFGLEKALVGVVNAYADDKLASRNNVVIAHEFLHTVGATDKYDIATNQPVYPDGYAAPDQQPRFPQKDAEIMGGRIPLSASKAEMPPGLNRAAIGGKTAREINWVHSE